MARFVRPSGEYEESVLSALVEFQHEGGLRGGDLAILAKDVAFDRIVQDLLDASLPDTPRPDGWVPQTTLWWVDDAEFIGMLEIRHGLTDELRKVGGHIGYAVRPSARRRGHATAMLIASLPVAAELGIDPALVTCLEGNVASKKVIEIAGGTLAENAEGRLRFWVPTRKANAR